MVWSKGTDLRGSDMSVPDFSLVNLLAHFAQSNRAEGKAAKTVCWYTEMLSEFVKFFSSRGRPVTLASLNPFSVREFIIAQQDKGLSPHTVACRVRALRSFSSWLMREGYTSDNVLAVIKPPKTPERLIEVLTPEEIDKLVSWQNSLTSLGSRNIAMFTTLIDTGLRISEICNLRFEDAHIGEGYFKVLGKGNKERVVPVGMLVQKVLYRYVFHYRPKPASPADDCLFLTAAGERLTTNAVRLLFKRWGKRAGIPRLHAHLCRHTYATSFLNQKCGDVFRLQQILGHTTLEMVRHYVHYASTQDMLEGSVSSPLDRLALNKLDRYRMDHLIRNRHR